MRLLIFKVNQLGDNVIFLPVVQWLQKALPGSEITVMTSSVAAPLYYTCTPGVNVILAETKPFNGAWKSPSKLLHYHRLVAAARPDVCLLASDQGNVASLLAYSSGAKLRVGGRLPRIRLNVLLNRRINLDAADHVALQNWQIMLALTKSLEVAPSSPTFPPAPDLSGFGLSQAEQMVLIHPGASREYKRWPLEQYVELANRLTMNRQVCFIIQGHTEERLLNDSVIRIRSESLTEFIQLMSRASLFIGNNSGPMNIASSLGVPGIIFNGPSTPNWDPAWFPERFKMLRDPNIACQPCDGLNYSVNRCINVQSPMVCMTRWSVEEVSQLALMPSTTKEGNLRR